MGPRSAKRGPNFPWVFFSQPTAEGFGMVSVWVSWASASVPTCIVPNLPFHPEEEEGIPVSLQHRMRKVDVVEG